MALLVTGTGRCGTGYMSKVLTSVGVKCTHERVFTLEGWQYALEHLKARRRNPHWGWQADSSWLAAPFLQKPELHCLTVVHLVRHPKKVIESNLRLHFFTHPHYGPYFRWMAKFIPKIDDFDTSQDKVVYWYLKLNQISEARADLFHRVENDPVMLLNKLGIDWHDKEIYDNTEYNSRPGYGPVEFDIDAIRPELKDRLLAMTEQYGYE